jgi:hypothetical protein
MAKLPIKWGAENLLYGLIRAFLLPRRCLRATFRNAAMIVLALLFHTPWQARGDEMIALYRFNTNGEDSLGHNPPFGLTNGGMFTVAVPSITNGVLYLDGRYEPNGHFRNYLGTPPLQDFDYNSFAVALDFCPLPQAQPRSSIRNLMYKLDSWTHGFLGRLFGFNQVPNVLDTSNIITGGSSYRWFELNRRDGALNLTLNNGAFQHRFGRVSVSPNRWHNLVCSVDLKRQQIIVWFDGRQLETVRLPGNFKLEVIGSSVERSNRGFTFTDYSNGSVAFGYAANFKIFGRALGESEITRIAALFPGECPAIAPRGFEAWQMILASLGALAVVIILTIRARRGKARGR